MHAHKHVHTYLSPLARTSPPHTHQPTNYTHRLSEIEAQFLAFRISEITAETADEEMQTKAT